MLEELKHVKSICPIIDTVFILSWICVLHNLLQCIQCIQCIQTTEPNYKLDSANFVTLYKQFYRSRKLKTLNPIEGNNISVIVHIFIVKYCRFIHIAIMKFLWIGCVLPSNCIHPLKGKIQADDNRSSMTGFATTVLKNACTLSQLTVFSVRESSLN